MNGLKGWLGKTIFAGLMKQEPEIVKTKSTDGEKLTDWEKDFIWKQLQKDGTIVCPNCESAKMLSGPEGGMSVNIRCPKCGQGINFLMLPSPNPDVSQLDWCDNIGIDESWIRKEIINEEV